MRTIIKVTLERRLQSERERLVHAERHRDDLVRQLAELVRNIEQDKDNIAALEEALA